jgi:hypothetical protein
MIAPAYISVGATIIASIGGGLNTLPTHTWWRAHAGSLSYCLGVAILLASAAVEDYFWHSDDGVRESGTGVSAVVLHAHVCSMMRMNSLVRRNCHGLQDWIFQ